MAEKFGESSLTDKEKSVLQSPDQQLIVAKQRHGAYEGGMGLYFNEALQFTATADSKLFFEFGDYDAEAY